MVRVAIARKRQARHGVYGGGVRPFGWGVDTGRVRSVCVNPKAPAMERVWEDRPVLDMTCHNEAEAAEIRRWADDLLSGVSMNHVLRDLAARAVPTVAMTDERQVRRNGKAARTAGGTPAPYSRSSPTRARRGTRSTRGRSCSATPMSPILHDDVREALITLFSDPARKTSPGEHPEVAGVGDLPVRQAR
jgi:hypothetical protein